MCCSAMCRTNPCRRPPAISCSRSWTPKRQIADLDNQIRQLDSDISNIVSDQTRIRQNMQSLNQVSGQQDQVQKYARQLATQESSFGQFARQAGAI